MRKLIRKENMTKVQLHHFVIEKADYSKSTLTTADYYNCKGLTPFISLTATVLRIDKESGKVVLNHNNHNYKESYELTEIEKSLNAFFHFCKKHHIVLDFTIYLTNESDPVELLLYRANTEKTEIKKHVAKISWQTSTLDNT